MSYGANVLTTYPSALLSDGYVQRSEFDTMYPSSMPYMTGSRLMSDDLAFDAISHNPPNYRQAPPAKANGYHPAMKNPYHNPVGASWPSSAPGVDFTNDITEYSESMGTASNTNTASTIARTVEDYKTNGFGKKPFKQPQNPNPTWNPYPGHSQPPQTWNAPGGNNNNNNKKKSQVVEEKPAPKYRAVPKGPPPSQPPPMISKKPLPDRYDDDLTPVPSTHPPMVPPRVDNRLQRNPTIAAIEKQPPSIDIEAWLTDSKKDPTTDDTTAEQAWSDKMNQLQMAQVQREKDKMKQARAVPATANRFDVKPPGNKTKAPTNSKAHENSERVRQETYFDSMFDGDYFRKPLSQNHSVYSSPQRPVPKRNKLLSNSFNDTTENFLPKHMRQNPSQRTPRYEPPSVKRAPPTITTTSWRTHWPRQHLYDPLYPYYAHPDFLHQEFIHKDDEERFREALQVMRAERAEQQQKQMKETTTKRLNYGDYVRNSTKDGSLHTTVKPSPWSDFMDVKKGNIYSLSQEEKKQMYNESKSYGELVRYRNFANQYDGDTARSHRHSVPLIDDVQEPQSSNVTPRQIKHDGTSKTVSRTSRRPESASTKRTAAHRMASNPNSRATQHRSDDERGTHSENVAVRRKAKKASKKKTVHYGRYDSSGRTTSGTDDSDTEVENRSQRSFRSKNRNTDDNLFTVREERTLESIEGSRYKKPVQKQKK